MHTSSTFPVYFMFEAPFLYRYVHRNAVVIRGSILLSIRPSGPGFVPYFLVAKYVLNWDRCGVSRVSSFALFLATNRPIPLAIAPGLPRHLCLVTSSGDKYYIAAAFTSNI